MPKDYARIKTSRTLDTRKLKTVSKREKNSRKRLRFLKKLFKYFIYFFIIIIIIFGLLYTGHYLNFIKISFFNVNNNINNINNKNAEKSLKFNFVCNQSLSENLDSQNNIFSESKIYYMLQVASMENLAMAEIWYHRLLTIRPPLAVNISAAESSFGKIFRVEIGPYTQLQDVLDAQVQLRKFGIMGAIRSSKDN